MKASILIVYNPQASQLVCTSFCCNNFYKINIPVNFFIIFCTDETCLGESDHSSIYYKLECHAASWKDIGIALGFSESELNIIENSPSLFMQAPKSFLRKMLSQWLQWAPGDGRGSTVQPSKESLRAALLRANLGQLAQQF